MTPEFLWTTGGLLPTFTHNLWTTLWTKIRSGPRKRVLTGQDDTLPGVEERNWRVGMRVGMRVAGPAGMRTGIRVAGRAGMRAGWLTVAGRCVGWWVGRLAAGCGSKTAPSSPLRGMRRFT